VDEKGIGVDDAADLEGDERDGPGEKGAENGTEE
jgi:hypothetical protein